MPAQLSSAGLCSRPHRVQLQTLWCRAAMQRFSFSADRQPRSPGTLGRAGPYPAQLPLQEAALGGWHMAMDGTLRVGRPPWCTRLLNDTSR